jgi:hypothetical protein
VVRLDQDLLPTTPHATMLGNTLNVPPWPRSSDSHLTGLPAWPVINVLTRSRLLAPSFSP